VYSTFSNHVQLHIGASSSTGEPTTPDAAEKSVDFFEEHSNGSSEAFSDQDAFFGHAPETPKLNEVFDADKPGPSVDGILSTSPSKAVPLKKSTIGARKPAAKKPGVGGFLFSLSFLFLLRTTGLTLLQKLQLRTAVFLSLRVHGAQLSNQVR
jgi:hypothetical protein